MSIVDANIILRFLLDDHDELSARAAEILESSNAILPVEVACEVVYVLQKVYQVARGDIQKHLGRLISEKIVITENPAVLVQALEFYRTTSFDFVDTLLLAYQNVNGQEIVTFDEKLQKKLDQIKSISN